MTKPPEVSVILPTYERREVVGAAVDSVLAQTLQDLELIVVDDGSTDGTGDALAALRDRLEYVWRPNGGTSAARNEGVRLASAEIVAFIDSDDRWLPEHLEVVTAMLAAHPESVLACTCPGYRVAGDEPLARTRVVIALPRLLVGDFVGFPSCVAVRRDALLASGGFDERLPVGEDTDLWQRLALLGPFALLRRRTVVRSDSETTISRRGRRAGLYLESHELSALRLLEELDQRPDAAPELAQRVRGKLHYTRALRALIERDDARLETELRRACALLPELSTETQLVIDGLWFHVPRTDDPREAVGVIASAALAWPDRRSQTGIALRVHAIRLALLRGRAMLVAVLLLRLPLLAVLPLALDRARRWAGRLLRAGR